jgi:hypothetical protein
MVIRTKESSPAGKGEEEEATAKNTAIDNTSEG